MEAEPPQEPGLIETLAAGVAHEVRNPLNSVQINLSILEQELADLVADRQAHVFAVLAKIAAEIKRLDDFVSEFRTGWPFTTIGRRALRRCGRTSTTASPSRGWEASSARIGR